MSSATDIPAHPDEPVAGPSTPRPSSPSPPPTPAKTLPLEAITTPAPHPSGQPDVPSAPAPHPPAKDLPTHTPLSSSTPSATHAAPDISEFDPFATPSAPPAAQSKGPEASHTVAEVTPSGRPSGESTRGEERRRQDSGASRTSRAEGETPFNFPGFLKDLRLKSAEPVARYLKSFLSNFAKKPFTVNEQIKLIHDFLNFIAEKMVQVEPWKSQSSTEFDNALEAMEKLVMNRLYNYTFTPQLVPSQPITTDDLERDAVFAQRVRLFGWIREKHLDVPEGEASQGFLGFAEQELLKINHYKAPRDKIICILNCCKVIFGLIRHTSGADGTTADAFVPILIFVVLHANPENMLSNVEYINRFRSAGKLSGEAGYYLSSLSGAIAFIETMDASSLSNITQEEFESNVETAIQALPPSPSSGRPPRPFPVSASSGGKEMSPFAPSTPGEEPARQLALNSFPTLEGPRRFLQRTGNTMSEAVSKPLNAISKILDGMQVPGTGGGGSISGDDSDGDGDGESGDERVERKWRAGGERDREAEIRGELLHAGPSPRTPTQRGERGERHRARTPDSPSRRFAQMGFSPDSLPNSGAGTPLRDLPPPPDFSSEEIQSTLDMSQESFDQTRRANVHTLHQMFPALDEDVAEAVLESCGNDLGTAIDTLLEM